MEATNRNFLRICVAKICQNVGWNFIHKTALELMTDLMQDYISSLAKTAYRYALHGGYTEPNLRHLAQAFQDKGISVTELKEYVQYMDSSCILDTPLYPAFKENHLNLLKPGSREVVTRPFHIHEHLPPMHPHLEDQQLSINLSPVSVETTNEPVTSTCTSPKSKLFKRPCDPLSDCIFTKRCRNSTEEENRPLREPSSVMMTTSGFLSPAREGKLPEARTPLPRLESVELNSDSTNHIEIKSEKKKKVKILDQNHKYDQTNEIDTSVREDDVKNKKLINLKEQPKLKCSTKSINSGVQTQINRFKSLGKAQPNLVNSQSVKSNQSNKTVKLKSPKKEKSHRNGTVLKENMSQVPLHASSQEYKLPVEPDRHKLNILKKISKVKEENEEVCVKIEPEFNNWTQIDFTIESVIKREMSEDNNMVIIEPKEEVVDIETVYSPSAPYDSLVPNVSQVNNVTTNQPNQKLEKKKKKDKGKPKKDCVEKSEVEQSKTVSDTAFEVVKASEEEPRVLSPVPFIPTALPTAPGLIPPTLPSLVPTILGTFPKKEPVDVPPKQIQKSDGELVIVNDNAQSNSIESRSPESLQKKKDKREKKDKLKKKKKNKLKNKEKSEKKKIKLDKKDKDKLKQKKERKEKRKEKESSESVNDDGKPDCNNAVPKITFKLGPVTSNDNTDHMLRKIVIKPVVKKDPDNVKQERPPSPELARFSPLDTHSKHKPPKNHVYEPKSTSSETVVEVVKNEPVDGLAPLPPSVRLDSEGNQVWICPGCGKQDDGSPMIGCDGCDAWYHWVCVGIQVPPDSSHWYCQLCLTKKKSENVGDKRKRNKKKSINKRMKVTVIVK